MTPSTPSPASTELSRAAGDPHPAAPEAAGERELGGAGPAGGWVTASPPKGVEIAQAIVRFPVLVARHKDLILTGVQRELRAQFTGTVLGFFWPLLQPVFLFLVFYFIFTKLLGAKLPDLPPGQEAAMGVYMFVGILMWAAFGESLTLGCNVIVDNGNLIKKLAFPAEVLPLNIVLVRLTTMMFGVSIFLLAAILTPVWVAPNPLVLLWIPVLVLLQALFTYGVTLFIATLQVFLRDTLQTVGILTMVWMFGTPVFWPAVPEAMPSIEPYLPYLRWNPMYELVQAWRLVLLSSEPAGAYDSTIVRSLAIFLPWALGSYAIGYAFFLLAKRRFADEV